MARTKKPTKMGRPRKKQTHVKSSRGAKDERLQVLLTQTGATLIGEVAKQLQTSKAYSIESLIAHYFDVMRREGGLSFVQPSQFSVAGIGALGELKSVHRAYAVPAETKRQIEYMSGFLQCSVSHLLELMLRHVIKGDVEKIKKEVESIAA